MPGKDIYHSFYKFYAFVRPELLKTGWGRDRLIRAVNVKGAPCFHGSCSEVYREKAFAGTGLMPTDRLPVSAVNRVLT